MALKGDHPFHFPSSFSISSPPYLAPCVQLCSTLSEAFTPHPSQTLSPPPPCTLHAALFPLLSQGFSIMAYDQAGHGHSGPPGIRSYVWDFNNLVDDLTAFVEKVVR